MNGQTLHETFDSKLKVETNVIGQDQVSTSEINQEVFQNFTESFVELFSEMEMKLPLIDSAVVGRIWYTKILRMKCARICEIGFEMFPELMKKLDESKLCMTLSKDSKISHLIYKDFD